MDNSSYRSQYIASDVSNMLEQSTSAVSSFWERVANAEAKLGKRLEDGYSREEYVALLEALNITRTSAFRSSKSMIGRYLKWLQGKDALDDAAVKAFYSIGYGDICSSQVYESKYFKNFDDLNNAIMTTLDAAEKVDNSVFATQISAIYLAWLGIPIEDVLLLKKEDIKDDTICLPDRTISPNSVIMQYLKDYRDAESYESQAKGIISLKYAKSKLLFRTSRTANISTPKTLRIMIRDFGLSGGAEQNDFNYDKIYWSGTFYRAYEYELANGAIPSGNVPLLEKLFNEKYPSARIANQRLYEYNSYKRYFYPEET